MFEWFRACKSVLAAFLGVQTDENRKRDFSEGKFSVFLSAGLLLTALFLAIVYGLVIFVMSFVR